MMMSMVIAFLVVSRGWAFRVAGVKGKTVKVTVVNIGKANAGSKDQFDKYKARYSYDRKKWFQVRVRVYAWGEMVPGEG
jgi:hypothetical protein